MITFLIVMLFVSIYGAGAGMTTKVFYDRVAQPKFQYRSNEMSGSVVAGLLWPVTMPAILAASIRVPKRTNRDETRREREITEAEHRLRVAEIEQREMNVREKTAGVLH